MLESVLPTKLLNKIHRITHQLDFITKYFVFYFRTTQILEARVANNGEQLRKLVELTNGLNK